MDFAAEREMILGWLADAFAERDAKIETLEREKVDAEALNERNESIRQWVMLALTERDVKIEALESKVAELQRHEIIAMNGHTQLSAKVAEFEDNFSSLAERIDELEREINNCASEYHYHDNYASAEHVERSENSFRNSLSSTRDELSNLEYRISEAERKAEHAQSSADAAQRQGRGYY